MGKIKRASTTPDIVSNWAMSSGPRGAPWVGKFGGQGTAAALTALALGAIYAASTPSPPNFQMHRKPHRPDPSHGPEVEKHQYRSLGLASLGFI